MKTLILILVVLGLTVAVQIRNQKLQQKVVVDLQESKMGKALLKLIQLHNQVKGPIDELVSALEALQEDLARDIEYINAYERQFVAEMNQKIAQTEQEIADAQTDIARTEDVLINLLYPRKKQLENKIQTIETNAAQNRKNLLEENLNREKANKEYLAVVEEYGEAVAAVDEALALLATITNPSLIQAKQIKKSIQKINFKAFSKIGKGPMIEALVQLALSQNFTDQDILGKIVSALNEFREDIVDATNKAHAEEEAAVAEHVLRVESLDAEYAEFQRAINATNVDLTATIDKIAELEEFKAQRQADLALALGVLEELKEGLAYGIEVLADIRDKYTHELAITEQAYQVVISVDLTNVRV